MELRDFLLQGLKNSSSTPQAQQKAATIARSIPQTAPPAQTVSRSSSAPKGFNRLRSLWSRGFDQANIFDNNLTWKQRTPTQSKSVLDQTGQAGGQLTRATVGNLTKMVNTGLAQVPQVIDTGRMLAADFTNNDQAWKNANEAALKDNQRFQEGKGGLLNVGTLYNAQDARNGNWTGVRKIVQGTGMAGLDVASLMTGANVGASVAKNGVGAGLKAEAGNLAKSGLLNTVQGGAQAYQDGSRNVGDIAKAALVSGALGTAGDVGLGLAGAAAGNAAKVVTTKLVTNRTPLNNAGSTPIGGPLVPIPKKIVDKLSGKQDPLESLKQEARKYKSAEEFVKAQGEPLYHGTTEKIQGDFKYPLYTTPKKDYAQVFADSTAASSISKSGKKLSDAPMVHEFAVNPKARVLDITNPAHRKLLEEQYFGKYSMSYDPVVGKNGHIDWTEGENLAEWIEETKQPFDAIRLDEGGGGIDPSSGLPVIDKGVSYLALNKNALKSKSQLTDLYNQATKPPKAYYQNVPKSYTGDPLEALKAEARQATGARSDYSPENLQANRQIRAKNASSITYADKKAIKPDELVTVYRAVPGKAKGGLTEGDWVTPNKEQARLIMKQPWAQDDTGAKIVTKKVKASELRYHADDAKGYVDDELLYVPKSDPLEALKQEARKYKSADEFVKNTDHTPQTTRVYIKSKFRDGGGYADVPVIREEKNITLYQGGTGENRQFWTPNKEYAKKFGNGEVVKKTGNFYQIDNGNRMTDVYVDADKQLTDLYNQAHTETKAPTPQAPQPTAPVQKPKPVDPTAALKQEAPQGTFYKGFKKDGSSTASSEGDAFYITPHENIAKTYDEGVGVKQYKFSPDTKVVDWKSPEYKAVQEKHMVQVKGGEPGYRKPDYNAINAELKAQGYDAITFKTPDGDSPQVAVINQKKVIEIKNQPGVHDSLADNLPNQTGIKNQADNVFSLTQQSPESRGIIPQKPQLTDLYNQTKPSLKDKLIAPFKDEVGAVGRNIRNTEDPIIREYADMLRSVGEGNGVAINPETGARMTNNVRFGDTKGKRMTKADWYAEAERQVKSGKADPAFMEYYNTQNNPETKSLLNEAEQGKFGKEPIGEVAQQPTLQDALNGKDTRIKTTGTKAVRTDSQMNSANSQTSVTPGQSANQPQAKIAKQPVEAQTTGRANASVLGQVDQTVSGTPQRTASKLPQAKSDILSPSTRQRGFVDTIIEDPKTAPKVKENLTSLYSVRNTKQLQTKAANLVKSDIDLATRVAKEDTSDIGVATGSELIKKLQADGNYEQAIDVASTLAETLTKAGQTSQAASIYGRLTPEGVLRFTQKEINKYNKSTGKNIKLSPEEAKILTEKATKVQSMPEGRARDIATKEMLKQVYETMPATWVEKVSTFQTMAQLLNPKTLIRNVGGNTIFSVLDNASQTLATGADKILSLKTGQRTTGIPSLKVQSKGLSRGFKDGYEEAVKGINLGPNTQFDLNEVPVFRNGVLGQAEKGLNISLRATDRAAYTAAFDDTLNNLMKLNKVTNPTTEMIEQAHYQGLYRTFQDESNAAKIFVGLKGALNVAGFEKNGKRWGLGDLILKYPKTPGNLIARGLDYSPVGVLRGMIETAKVYGGTGNQLVAANSLARGVVGTGSLIGSGYALAGLGLITEKPEENKDLRNLQKTAGLGGYQLNISGLKRFLMSGFNTEEAKLRKGDSLVSYDWAQPAAIPLSMGAAMGRGDGIKKGTGQSLSALSEGVQTLAEQPLVQGVQQFFGSNKGAVDTLADTVKGAPASFVPTLSNQIRQLTDNTSRNTSDPSALKEAYNKAINRVPGLASTLPASVDVLGDNKKNYQNNTNNPFNVFLNPAFVNKYQPNDVATLNLGLNKQTGETKQLPNTVKNKVTINGQEKALTGREQGEYQKYVGTVNSTATDMLTKNPRFNSLSDSQKVNLMAGLQTDINNAAKTKLFGDQANLTESSQSIVDNNLERAIELKLRTQEKVTKTKTSKTKTARVKVAKVKKASKGKGGKGRKGSGKVRRGKKVASKYSYKLFAFNSSPSSTSKSLRDVLKKATIKG